MIVDVTGFFRSTYQSSATEAAKYCVMEQQQQHDFSYDTMKTALEHIKIYFASIASEELSRLIDEAIEIHDEREDLDNNQAIRQVVPTLKAKFLHIKQRYTMWLVYNPGESCNTDIWEFLNRNGPGPLQDDSPGLRECYEDVADCLACLGLGPGSYAPTDSHAEDT